MENRTEPNLNIITKKEVRVRKRENKRERERERERDWRGRQKPFLWLQKCWLGCGVEKHLVELNFWVVLV